MIYNIYTYVLHNPSWYRNLWKICFSEDGGSRKSGDGVLMDFLTRQTLGVTAMFYDKIWLYSAGKAISSAPKN